ncbi:MAG: PA2169 family four-helix-bundle protein [Alphaproteobacteria bacterium]|nr:PA2169 family four-helix-bundle protein [Alphaproteobacteria bacterium]
MHANFIHPHRKADDPQIRKTFQNLEKLHRGVIVNLQQHVRANGGDAKARETMTGQAAQFWGSLMTSISNDVDETLVNNLEEAEDRCLHSIEDALKEPDFRSATKDILIHEKSTLQRSHDYMKTLKDTLRAA